MGVHCYLIPIPERVLMHLDEGAVPDLFREAQDYRIASAAEMGAASSAVGTLLFPLDVLLH